MNKNSPSVVFTRVPGGFRTFIDDKNLPFYCKPHNDIHEHYATTVPLKEFIKNNHKGFPSFNLQQTTRNNTEDDFYE